MSGENQTPVVFAGKASEYFGIWIVNLLLSSDFGYCSCVPIQAFASAYSAIYCGG
ncbi:DUF898 domain-containing protein [Methylobacillus caricis]|uniref:DUF898 domain-containing protein n=1 Tax=Methylobacillus caricis TaxID=1971611 RepID=UPI001CFFF361|nr:DUF898 domain-containing protein [Methylobacillus caricis]MCB5187154.1 DUF898 domain-containing protein [Methylobacillus caricis]